MKEIIDALEAKRAAGGGSGQERLTTRRSKRARIDAHGARCIFAWASHPRLSAQRKLLTSIAVLMLSVLAQAWTSPNGRIEIDFERGNWRVVGPPYAAPEVIAEARDRTGTGLCELSALSREAPGGSQDHVNAAIRSLEASVARTESPTIGNHQVTIREVDSVSLLISSGRFEDLETITTRFGLYHGSALQMYTLTCSAAANDHAGVASMRAAAGALHFPRGDVQ